MKSIIIIGIVSFILTTCVSAFDFAIYDKYMNQSRIFSPGDRVVIEGLINTTNATIEILYNNMEKIKTAYINKSANGTFNFIYDLPKDLGNGNYLIRVISEDAEDIQEIMVANKINMQFVDKDSNISKELKEKKEELKEEMELKENSFFQKMLIALKNIWVNYVWIKE